MKLIKECVIIFGITLVGEMLNVSLPFPVPAGVYGLFILLALLCAGGTTRWRRFRHFAIIR